MQKELVIDHCSYDAVKFACEHFHYARRVPAGKLVKYGVWEDGLWIGCILFGDSMSPNMHIQYNLEYTEVCELRRVALLHHNHNVTHIVSKSLKLLKKENPKLQLVLSYADKNQDHLGIIYQAGNWIYEGETRDRESSIMINGEKIHARTAYDRYGTGSLKWIKENVDENAYGIHEKGKYKYLYPLTKKARKMFSNLAKPYPKSL